MKRRDGKTLRTQLRHHHAASRKSTPLVSAPTWLHLPRGNKQELPARFRHDAHVRAADSLVEWCIEQFTRPGQVVFDPFAGYGTTLLTAEGMGRSGYGIEFSRAKAVYVQALLQEPAHLVHGDARRLRDYDLPPIDLCLTSPPYTNRGDTEDPFVDYRQKGSDYAAYLQETGGIFSQVAEKLRPGGRLVIEASNLKKDGEVTTLAWDIAREVSRFLHFEGETVFCWDEYGYGYSHSYGLVFSKSGG
jgi:SAM-dependent methyltransferase